MTTTWKTLENKGNTIYLAEAAAGEELDVLLDAWRLFLNKVAPAHSSFDWDTVIVSIWSESARIILYPAREGDEDRSDRAHVQVVSGSLRNAHEEAEHHLENDDEPAFVAAIEKMEADWAARIVALAPAEVRRQWRVEVWSAGDSVITSCDERNS